MIIARVLHALRTAIVCSLVLVTGARAAPGDLDMTFGTAGRVVSQIPGTGAAIAVQSDGKILSAFTAVVRFNSGGTLDSTFGVGGVVSLASFGFSAFALLVQSDGRILAIGVMTSSRTSAALIRLNEDGSIDRSFGSSGIAQTDFGVLAGVDASIYPKTAALLPDGRILVGGTYQTYLDKPPTSRWGPPYFGLARFLSDGKVDPSFGTRGRTTTSFGLHDRMLFTNALLLLPSGRVLVVGQDIVPAATFSGSEVDFAAAQYTADGVLDPAFGQGGKITNPKYLGAAAAEAADGTIWVSGDSLQYGYLARLRPDGSLDTSFDPSGVKQFFFESKLAGTTVAAMAVQNDGKVLVAGARGGVGTDSVPPLPHAMSVMRFNQDGTPDPEFGVNGAVVVPIVDREDYVRGMVLQPNGDIILDGFALAGPITNQVEHDEIVRLVGDAAVAASNYEGLWWASPAGSESGWGINFAHQGDVIFATWFTYDATGKAWWLSMLATKTATGEYRGTLYATHGPAFSATPFDPTQVTRTAVGNATLSFTDANDAQFVYTVNGVTQTKTLTREVFATLPSCTFGTQSNLALATNYQDLWWAAPGGSESGWGINLTEQSNIIFGTWFTYDVDGTPLWLSVTANNSAPGVFSGALYRTTGPAFNAVPFNPTNVKAMAVGTATFTFADGNNATFAYTVGNVTQAKAITREVFVSPGTLCQ